MQNTGSHPTGNVPIGCKLTVVADLSPCGLDTLNGGRRICWKNNPNPAPLSLFFAYNLGLRRSCKNIVVDLGGGSVLILGGRRPLDDLHMVEGIVGQQVHRTVVEESHCAGRDINGNERENLLMVRP